VSGSFEFHVYATLFPHDGYRANLTVVGLLCRRMYFKHKGGSGTMGRARRSLLVSDVSVAPTGPASPMLMSPAQSNPTPELETAVTM
jgi:hypothetical protein